MTGTEEWDELVDELVDDDEQATERGAAPVKVTAPPQVDPTRRRGKAKGSAAPAVSKATTLGQGPISASRAAVRGPIPTAAAGKGMIEARTGMPAGPSFRTEITPPPGGASFRTEITPPPGSASVALRTEITPPPGVGHQRTEIAVPDHPERSAHSGAQQTGAPAPRFEALDLSEGTRIKQFELIRELGRGGMGQVFRARDTKLGRLVAIKFLALTSAELTERFLVEARATARCQHENIVVIYEADEWNGQPYMVLEYLEGGPLSAEIEGGGTVSPRRAVELMIPVVRALARAHEFHIVHRDLKPDNIFVTQSGVVKVLDFGIAKLFETNEAAPMVGDIDPDADLSSSRTQAGRIIGTMPYMSPEQWGADTVDHRTDIWAVGIILWELLTGGHPLDPLSPQRLMHAAAHLDQPMPRIGAALPSIPGDLERIIDRCLTKRKEQRFSTAAELLRALEALAPGRYTQTQRPGSSPYPGLVAFQESDANRFFGREHDVIKMVQRMRDEPLLGIVGASGVGKSSLVRAGVVPELKSSGEDWEVMITRPGRDPISALATLLQGMSATSSTAIESSMYEHAQLVKRLRTEPGYLGTFLRSRARQKQGNILMFVDQFEELYTLVPDAEKRRAYTACLSGVADDASAPLRVVVSMRSDFLDRAAEDRGFMERLTRGLVFLPPIEADGMRDALVQPLEMQGYHFEDEGTVDRMLAELADTPGSLPLLQFTAAKLWDQRDERHRMLPTAAYDALGGVAGALATHADDVLQRMPSAEQKLVRGIFQRLVTSEGTRAIVEVSDLEGLADREHVLRLVDKLVQARLLATQSRGDGDGRAIEIVHESLISSWPTLKRWLEERGEDAAFIEQLRSAAKQWDARGRPVGLLWRGETMEEAKRFKRRHKGELARLESDYLAAVLDLSVRASRRRRRLVIGAFVFLLALVAAGAVALIWVREAEQIAQRERSAAQKQRASAQKQRALAVTEAERARDAEAKIKAQLEEIRRAQADKKTALEAAEVAEKKAKTGEEKLALTYDQLRDALKRSERDRARAEAQKKKAEAATEEARKAKKEAERLLAKERKRSRELEKRARKLTKGSDLK